MSRRFSMHLLPLCLLPLALGCGKGSWCKLHQVPSGEDAESFTPLSHSAMIQVDPEHNRLEVVDTLFYEGSFSRFQVHKDLVVDKLVIGGKRFPQKQLRYAAAESGDLVNVQLCKRPPEARFAVIHLEGELWQDPRAMTFGHEKVGQELRATVGPEGLWLSGSAGVLPRAGSEGLPTRIRFDLPEEWAALSNGELIAEETVRGRRTMTWQNSLPGHFPDMIAGPYDVRRELHEGVSIETWFFEREEPLMGMHGEPVDDEEVRNTLHRMSNYYMDMYTDLVGPYPFDRFSIVESFFPSGYGMPGWTLLGEHVIRMPYLPYTSLGHELLHNWWGNGVLVDNSEGNWCEGLTVYQADYRYKEQEGADKARAYRRDVLKSWLNYTLGSEDLPLRDFRSRHDGATRAVGYGKSLMVFVMLEDILSKEILELALRDLAQDFMGREAAWSDIIAACEARGRVDLSRFAEQWITRAGAPNLELGEVAWDEGLLRGELRQIQPGALDTPYEIDVSLRIECHDGSVIQPLVYMDSARAGFEIECPEPRRLSVDPDARLFRRMHEGEIEAVISQMLAEEQPLLVAPGEMLLDPAQREALQVFGNKLFEEEVELLNWGGYDSSLLAGRSVVFVSPPTIPEGLQAGSLAYGPQDWRYENWQGQREGGNLVLALKSVKNPRKGALLFAPSSLDNLGFLARKVPHYGKYSILDFDDRGVNQLKGNAQPVGSPLEVRFGSW